MNSIAAPGSSLVCLFKEKNLVLSYSSKRKPLCDNVTRRPRYSNFTIKSVQTYTSKITIRADMPLFEVPHASFDRYMEDKPRVFKAIFPDNKGTQRLNEEEWRIRMEPIGFLFLSAWPVVNMRITSKTKPKEYPPGVPTHTSKVLELSITKWDLEGVTDQGNKPSEFKIGMEGALYPDRKGARSRIRGHFHMTLCFAPPPILDLVPTQVHQDIAQTVMKNMGENMKHKVTHNLLADYTKFKKETPKISTISKTFP